MVAQRRLGGPICEGSLRPWKGRPALIASPHQQPQPQPQQGMDLKQNKTKPNPKKQKTETTLGCVSSFKLPALLISFCLTHSEPVLPVSESRAFSFENQVSVFTLYPRYSGIGDKKQKEQVSRNYQRSLSPTHITLLPVTECCPCLCRSERRGTYFCSSDNSHLLRGQFPSQCFHHRR